MTRNTKNTKKAIVIACFALVLVIGGSYVYAASQNGYWPFPADTPSTAQDETDKVSPDASGDANASDPTYETDKNSSVPETDTEAPTESTDKNEVGVGVASATRVDSQVEIRAFAIDVVEGDGTCTASLTKNGATVSESSKAFIDASTSQCGPIDIPASRFNSTGTWTLVVTYSSPTSTGKSAPLEVNL